MAVREFGRFMCESLRHPGGVGAIAPSSRRLAHHMVQRIDWGSVNTVVEFGPGTGVFTAQILQCKRPGTEFFAVELNSQFVATLERRFPDVTFLEDSVANIEALCRQRGVSEVDAIVCGLPWAAFSDRDQTAYLDAMMRVLKPGGHLATFAYLPGMVLPAAHRFRRKLRSYFGEVHMSPTVWLNVPPAFVYRCWR
ncbi:MAG: methyltransferase domain-containing protein [Planctomycetota bacterium]|nr:methyltransferase domain-containing protein [Planctomycetota bacterium]